MISVLDSNLSLPRWQTLNFYAPSLQNLTKITETFTIAFVLFM